MNRSKHSKKSRVRRLTVENLCSRQLLASDLMNPIDPIDVNADQKRSAIDALTIVNYLARQSFANSDRQAAEGEATGESPSASMYPDTNGDGRVSPSDALKVINALAVADGEEVPAPAPDLRFVDLEFEDGQGNDLVGRLKFNVQNIGTEPADFKPSSVPSRIPGVVAPVYELNVFSNGEQAIPTIVQEEVLRNFDPGETVLLIASTPELRSLEAGIYEVEVILDPDDAIDELSESNNVIRQTFTVGGPATSIPSVNIAGVNVVEGGVVEFTLTRTGEIDEALSIQYTTSGTVTTSDFSTNGNSLDLQGGTATFAPGVSEISISAQSLDDTVAEQDETVSLTLIPSADFSSDTSTAQSLLIDNDSDGSTLPSVSVATAAQSVNEGQTVEFTLTRSADTSAPLTVAYTTVGDASASDFDLTANDSIEFNDVGGGNVGGSVTFPAGSSSVTVVASSVDDGNDENTENIGLSVVPNATEYSIGSQAASANIEDNDGIVNDGGNSVMLDGLTISGGSSPTLTYSASNTEGTLTVQADGTIIVTDAQGIEIGRRSFGRVPKVLKLRITGHRNDLTMNGLVTSDDLRIEDKGFGNILTLENSSVGDDFHFEGNNHDNRLELSNVNVADIFHFDGNRGNDLLEINGIAVGDDFKFFGDDGSDALILANATVGDDAIVRGGDHNDLVAALNVAIRDVADIQGDRDFDSIIASVASITARKEKVKEFESAQAAASNLDEFYSQVRTLLESSGVPSSDIDRFI